MADECLICVKITPKSDRNQVLGWRNNELCIRISAIPDKGQANAELVRFLSKTLKTSRTMITIVRGEASRHKQIRIQGLSQEEVLQRLPGPRSPS